MNQIYQVDLKAPGYTRNARSTHSTRAIINSPKKFGPIHKLTHLPPPKLQAPTSIINTTNSHIAAPTSPRRRPRVHNIIQMSREQEHWYEEGGDDDDDIWTPRQRWYSFLWPWSSSSRCNDPSIYMCNEGFVGICSIGPHFGEMWFCGDGCYAFDGICCLDGIYCDGACCLDAGGGCDCSGCI